MRPHSHTIACLVLCTNQLPILAHLLVPRVETTLRVNTS